jgi:hypothetical protein
MRPAYVRVDISDSETNSESLFAISPLPFLYCQGELLIPVDIKTYEAKSYSAVCAVLANEFHIPEAMLPSAKYFEPTKDERANRECYIYRVVPDGEGVPVWRTRAHQAVIHALDEAHESSIFGNGKITINGKDCFSIEEIEDELTVIAEVAGGRARIEGEPYQPDYHTLVKEALSRDAYLIEHSRLRKKRKHNS